MRAFSVGSTAMCERTAAVLPQQLPDCAGVWCLQLSCPALTPCTPSLLLQACVELLKPTGGKVHAFISGLPNTGSKALRMRDSNATLAEKEKQMGLLPQDNTYLTLAAQAADFNVGTSLLNWHALPCCLATLPHLCSTDLLMHCFRVLHAVQIC